MKSIVFALLIFINVQVQAQVQLVLNPQNPVQFSSQDVWDLTVFSMQDESFQVYLTSTIVSDGGQIAQVTSQTVTLNSGANNFNPSNLSTASIKYSNHTIGDFESRSGHLPPGNYSYCVAVRCADQHCLNTLKIEENFKVCAQVQVQAPTPLLLALPRDEAKLKEKRPNFSWIPPMPIGNDPAISYQITLVELRKSQSAQTGIQQNRPIYRAGNISGTNLSFPAELDDLIVGNKYAWKVEAYLGKHFVQTSQVWEFEIVEEKEEVIPMPFVKLKKSDPAIYNALGELKFIYDEPRFNNEVSFSILSASGSEMNTDGLKLQTSQGENKFRLALKDYQLIEQQVYRLRIQRDNGETFILRFKYYEPN